MSLLSPSRSGPPPVPNSAVLRRDLVDHLESAARSRLTQLIAPPGSGKSVLLAQWCAAHPARLTGWLLLEPSDTNAVQFAAHFVEAIRGIDPTVGEAALERVESTGIRMGSAFLESLLDDLAAIPESVLVIEDLHVLGDGPLIAELSQLIESAPAQLHFVVSTRSDPALDVRRLRANGDVTELRAHALAFDSAATRALVARLGHTELADGAVTKLVARTEGWVAGIQLAALAMRATRDVESLIDEFAGDERLVAEYLTEEILSRQQPDVRRFLCTTSVLHRLAAPLCDSVTGDRHSQRMLETLERGGLFVTRIDVRGRWFRYHPLFRDLLRYTLVAEDPDLEAPLLRRAANWHLAEGQLVAAVEYLIEARAWDEVTDLVLRHGRELWEQGDASTAVQWLEAIPQRARSLRPMARLATALLYGFAGRSIAATQIIDELEADDRVTPGERLFATSVRASLVQHGIPPSEVIDCADRVLSALDTPVAGQIPDVLGLGLPSRPEMTALVSKGRALFYDGQRAAARLVLSDAVAKPGMSYPPYAVHTFGALALVEATTGNLVRARELATRALAVAQETGIVAHPAAGDALLALGRVECEHGDHERAAFLLGEALERAQLNRRHSVVALWRIESALLHLALGEHAAGLRSLEPAHGEPAIPRGIGARAGALRAELLIAQGDLAKARSVLDEWDPATAPELSAAAVHLAIVQRDLGRAGRLLDDWPEDGELGSQIARALWHATVLGLEGSTRRAIERMGTAVALAEPEGHVRVFATAGQDAQRVLRGLARSHPSSFLRRLEDPLVAPPPVRPTSPGLVEQLTHRELLVLRYLPGRLSNAEIAEQLYVSMNTVKTHLKHIYRKLGVAGRADAVAVAEALQLL